MVGAGRAAPGTAGQPTPPNRSVRRPWSGRPLAVLAAALLVAGSGGCAVLAEEIPGQAKPVDPARPPAGPLDGDAPLTQGDLAQVSAEQLLDESLVALVTQPVLHTRMESLGDVATYVAGGDYTRAISEGGFDFRTNEYAYHQIDGFNVACAGGKAYRYDKFDAAWQPGGLDCEIGGGGTLGSARSTLELIGTVSEGVLTAGLTVDEARAYVGSLREDYPGYLDVGELSLVEHDGRQYVRMPVVFRALDGNGEQYGMSVLIWAFRAIGPRWETHVLTPGSGQTGVSQVEAVYYLDPKTRLPAYSESLLYYPPEDPAALEGDVSRIEYLWDGVVPRETPGAGFPVEPPPLSWPAGRLAPTGR
jgi:hypothetical protein